jgi:hypothetical protein
MSKFYHWLIAQTVYDESPCHQSTYAKKMSVLTGRGQPSPSLSNQDDDFSSWHSPRRHRLSTIEYNHGIYLDSPQTCSAPGIVELATPQLERPRQITGINLTQSPLPPSPRKTTNSTKRVFSTVSIRPRTKSRKYQRSNAIRQRVFGIATELLSKDSRRRCS